MQRVLCFGASFYVALLYLISRYDPSNLLLWFSSMNQTTLFAHFLAVGALLFLGIKTDIEHTGLRRLVLAAGLFLIVVAALGTFTKILSLPLKPLDYMLAISVAIAAVIKGLTLPMLSPDGEPAEAPKKISLTYPLHVLRYGALAIKNVSAPSPASPIARKTHTA